MTVTNVHKDPDALTMALTAEFDAPAPRIWQLWDDPRQLERWWGPPTYPATVVDHDLRPGGSVAYFMTGPEGDKAHGWWRVRVVEPPHRLEFDDGFADSSGQPDPTMPTMSITVQLDEETAGRTRMRVATTFSSTESMEQVLAMGIEEGMIEAMSQIDDILSAPAGRR
jgi:uncharacterized protein YndB with AHSA1/START domain